MYAGTFRPEHVQEMENMHRGYVGPRFVCDRSLAYRQPHGSSRAKQSYVDTRSGHQAVPRFGEVEYATEWTVELLAYTIRCYCTPYAFRNVFFISACDRRFMEQYHHPGPTRSSSCCSSECCAAFFEEISPERRAISSNSLDGKQIGGMC